MGDDSAVTPLANRARLLPSYFKQRFAQVTNPPIDHLRERLVMSLRTLLGARVADPHRGPEAARLIELESFFVFPSALDALETVAIDATFSRDEGLRAACERIAAEAEAGRARRRARCCSSATPDRRRSARRSRRCSPSARCTSTSSQTGLRTRTSLVVARATSRARPTTSRRSSASAPTRSARGSRSSRWPSSPRRTRSAATVPTPIEAQLRFKKAIEDGVLKIMSKMGISDVA